MKVIVVVTKYIFNLIFRSAYQIEWSIYNPMQVSSKDSHKKLHQRAVRSIYLVTYSQTGMRLSTRESFVNEGEKCFQTTKANVLLWVCCI